MDDGIPLEDIKGAEAVPTEGKKYCVDEMISQAKLRADARIGATTWQESDGMDCTRVIKVGQILKLKDSPISD